MPGRYHRRLSSPDLDLVVAINETLEPARFALSDGYRVQALRAVTQAARPSTVAPQAAALIEIAVGQSPD